MSTNASGPSSPIQSAISETHSPTATTSKPEPDELEVIEESIAARKRHPSFGAILNPNHYSKQSSEKQRQKLRSDAGEEAVPAVAGGLEADGSQSEIEEDDIMDGPGAVGEEEFQIRQSEVGETIHVYKSGHEVDPEIDEGTPELEQEYVWDVLFENQRGIYLFGKAYFSTRTLLPNDPSPYTVPCCPIPSASSFAVSHPSTSQSNGTPHRTTFRKKPLPRPAQPQSNDKGRSIKTLYTLETYQPPSPAWSYITPWMVNMRQGTDEVGWRYNAWFKSGGWSSHAGALGWWGWVRRREWVRLRCLTPKPVEVESPEIKREEAEPKLGTDLNEVLDQDDVQGNLTRIIKVMGPISLDRHKLEVWEEWSKTKDEVQRARLQSVLENESAVSTLQRRFTYHTNFPRVIDLLRSHGFTIAQISSAPGSPRS